MDYLKINKQLWNNRTKVHYNSKFYDNETFIQGRNSLTNIELELLGDVKNKSILHLQCHFGQDSISLSRMGATVTGVDLSDVSIEKANELAALTRTTPHFICSDIYSLKEHLDEQFDIVFTSFGTIGWLPDMEKWAEIINHFLKPDGLFVIAEFHPVVWMFNEQFSKITYSYFNKETIVLNEEGTYTDRNADIKDTSISWNHDLAEVFTALFNNKMQITSFKEFDYSPFNCFNNTEEVEKGKFQIRNFLGVLPMVYALKATKIS